MDIIPSSAAYELCKMLNGGREIDVNSCVGITPVVAQQALDLTKAALKEPMQVSDEFKKTVTLATGATYYDLRAPSLLFSPTITPIRNSIKRTSRPHPGDAARWKAINALTNSPNLMAWVPEGRRNGSITYSMVNKSQAYATLGTEDSVTDEAKYAAVGFEDEEALIQLRALLKLMQIEENSLLWGNTSVALGTPTAPTLTQSGSTGTLPALTYSVIVVALTGTGYQQATLAGGLVTQVAVTSNDGQGAFNVNGGVSNKSAAATQVITLGQILNASVPIINGAVAYAWYVGAAGAETLQAITTINSATFSVPLTAGRQAATVFAADYSQVSTAFDGLITQAFNNAGVAYIKSLATGVVGAGTQLTSVGNGEITEIRDMCRTMWETYRVSVSKLYVNAQELSSLTKLALNSGGSTPLIKFNTQLNNEGAAPVKFTAGAVIGWYFNAFTADGGAYIPIMLHPNIVPGTIFGWCEMLPPTYMSAETPTVAEVLTRQDYYVEKWPRTSRAQFYGTYAQEAVAVYAPFCLAVITNIAPTS